MVSTVMCARTFGCKHRVGLCVLYMVAEFGGRLNELIPTLQKFGRETDAVVHLSLVS